MDMKLISKDKNAMEVEILEEDETLLEPLKQKLLEDKNVEVATYLLGHPMLENPKIYIKVKTGKPQSAIKKAAKALTNEYEELQKLLEKETAREEE